MNFDNVPALKNDLLNVIIETPKGWRNKYNYDPELELFCLKKCLPLGMEFPFDFGFIPNTVGEDGDPLDVLVIMEDGAYPGCLLQCKPLGVLKANQKKADGIETRNDRIVCIASQSILFAGINELKELNKDMVRQVEDFFVDYNKREGKVFSPIGWYNADEALKTVYRHLVSLS